MIDSINQVVENIKYLDRNYLKNMLNIYVNETKDEKGNPIYYFNYRDIKFIYHVVGRNLRLETTTHKILEKRDITLSDKEIFENKINGILNNILNTKNIKYSTKQTRNDYYTDVFVGIKTRVYMEQLKKHSSTFRRMKRKKKFKSSAYLETDTGRTLNLYDKETCIKDKAQKKIKKIKKKYKHSEQLKNFKIKEIEDYANQQCDLYKGILRLEIQIPKRTLRLYEKTSKKANKNDENVAIAYRKIDYYWNKKSMQKHYFDVLRRYLYEGDYYKLSKAINIIQNSNMTNKWKEKLICFLGIIKYYGIDIIKRVDIYSYGTVRVYIEKLGKIGINPITLDEDCEYDMLEGLYSLARKKAEADYFI